MKSFHWYMQSQLKDERRSIQIDQAGTVTLVSNLVRTSEETTSDWGDGWAMKLLTEAEILGNIFVFKIASHDTTAISTAYAMLLLVAHPKVQDWVHQELECYLKGSELKRLN